MDYIDLEQELQRLEAAKEWNKLHELLDLQQAFPEARGVRVGDRFRVCSTDVNIEVDSIEFVINDDGSVWAWPYAVVSPHGDRLYSEPAGFAVGDEVSLGFGVRERRYWDDAMKAVRIPRFVISMARDYLNRRPPISYGDDDGEQQTLVRNPGEES